MSEKLFEEETFQSVDFSENAPEKGKYDNCTFVDCKFSNLYLSHLTFIECRFKACDFSMAKMNNTALREVHFLDCKLLGTGFEYCNPFLLSVSFEDTHLELATFCELNLEGTVFKNCKLLEVDFSGANLEAAVFDQCDLERTIFQNTNLQKADFRNAWNYRLDPEQNQIRQAKFLRNGLSGLLEKYGLKIE